jgi:protocatechuate 3,4-dioxygenase beta subunit
MSSCYGNLGRRRFLKGMAVGTAAITLPPLWTPGVMADELTKTPLQTAGPFYPNKLPLDTDNDLLIINDSIDPAVGKITHLTGKVLDVNGNPIRNALVEIWQVDNNGAYLHEGSDNRDKWDSNFQGFGRFLTSRKGEYYFRTIKPVSYPGRTPHIHVAVKRKGRKTFTTQCYIKGHKQNRSDGILQSVRDRKVRDSLIIDFAPIKDSKIGELQAQFNIVLAT